ncbi:MAG: hypothetical protein BHV71_07030 [Bacteroides sp. 41_26]|nr:MAG: hypothetical protein BHV71_07030 [Bacteroides sp. 41_26]
MVGTQAVMNVMTGERYKMVPKEIIDYLKGLYGKAPAKIDEEVRKKVFKGEDVKVITHRPADDIPPQLDMYREKYKDICKCDEDVLTCALFENVAEKFLTKKYSVKKEEEVETVEAAAPCCKSDSAACDSTKACCKEEAGCEKKACDKK